MIKANKIQQDLYITSGEINNKRTLQFDWLRISNQEEVFETLLTWSEWFKLSGWIFSNTKKPITSISNDFVDLGTAIHNKSVNFSLFWISVHMQKEK